MEHLGGLPKECETKIVIPYYRTDEKELFRPRGLSQLPASSRVGFLRVGSN
jgi:hypothetical protein